MTILNFDIEAHREDSDGPLVPVSIDVLEVRPRARIDGVRVLDVSEAFNPMPELMSDFAYHVQFSLSTDFEDSDPVFDALAKVGFDKKRLIAACREAVVGWSEAHACS